MFSLITKINTTNKMQLIKTAITTAILATGVSAFGAGFQVQEQGASNMGTAMAGAVSNANNDASAAFLNPAAVKYIDMEAGKTMVTAAISAVIPTLGLSTDGKEYDCAVNAFVPNIFTVHKFTDDIFASLSVTAPFGLECEYDSNWIGRQMAIQSVLLTTDINPSLTYKVNDWFAFGGGISAQYAYCKLTNGVPGYPIGDAALSGNGWGVGGNVGFTVDYMEGGRFSFAWRSAVQQDLEGTLRVFGASAGSISASVEMPQSFTFGVYQRLPGYFDNFAVMADYSYTAWSSFDRLTITGATSQTTIENWKDTSRVSGGLHYYPEQFKDLTLRIGFAYDESPIDCAEYRTARIPCSDRLWYTAGFGYQIAENIKIDMSYAYIMTIGNSDSVPSQFGGTQEGHYYGHIHVLSAQVSFVF